ncbi:MAG: tRNA (adenosine(37)-N6)-threonylcarbamoyltransferase complex dimerization subunit type 1 TsaB [Chloroflexi bacterium]|nr:tRNA (adenosine(37)-N6)-threonylcarbamoyltransferase complex dimerization subunit type 1 TsaB [Chloroflexota bacterium]
MVPVSLRGAVFAPKQSPDRKLEIASQTTLAMTPRILGDSMLLAIDTATRTASIALYDAAGVHAELTWRSRENHTVELMTQVTRVLELAHVAKEDLQAIGVALGPGSFTGLRVGMSVAKGLVFARQIPLLAIPTLDAIAHAHAQQTLPIWAILAAGRGRYSVAQYTAKRSAIKRVSNYALVDAAGLIDLVTRALDGESKSARALFCGDLEPALARALTEQCGARALVASPARNARRAAFLAELAWARFQRGESDDPRALAPMYLPHESVEGAAESKK